MVIAPLAVFDFLKSTLALLVFVGAGIFGMVDDVDIGEQGIMVETRTTLGVAFGNVAYHSKWDVSKRHEYGHLVHEDELGVLYLPLAILGSIEGMRRYRQSGDLSDYLSTWTERMADEYGGVTR